jgi:mannose/fructose/N-acetylgalactosamine-specific phosphotransferase system component IIC
MEKELILLLILGGLAALDMTEAWQTMLSQALVSATLVGWIMGDLKAGIEVGIFLQLLYFWVVPMGVALFPDTSLGGVFGAFTFISLQKSFALEPDKMIFITLIFALAFSLFCERLLIFHRKNSIRWVRWVEKNLEKDKFKITQAVFFELLTSFLRGVFLTGLGILICHYLILPLTNYLDFIPNNYFAWCEWGLVGFGLATAFNYFGKRKNLIWLGLGIIIGILIILL